MLKIDQGNKKTCVNLTITPHLFSLIVTQETKQLAEASLPMDWTSRPFFPAGVLEIHAGQWFYRARKVGELAASLLPSPYADTKVAVC